MRFPHALASQRSRGFTLIEILVVVSIIGLLASIVLSSLGSAKQKADNAKRIVELREIQKALVIFDIDNNRMPYNHSGGDYDTPHYVADPNQAWWGACDGPMPGMPGGGVDTPGCGPDCGYSTLVDPDAYNASMQELVDAHLLNSIPHGSNGVGYCYISGHSGDDTGALVVTELPGAMLTTTGPPGSCRPFSTANGTWCESGQPNTSLCYCTPY